MRPVDFYALPAKRTETWHQSFGDIEHFFDDEFLENDIDRGLGKAAPADAPALTFEAKLFHNGDGERTVTYSAGYWKGKPFGLVVKAGRGGDENVERAITDIDAYREALAYLRTFLPQDLTDERDLAQPDAELPVLLGFYGYSVATAPAGDVRLVPDDHFDAEGRILLDEIAYRAAFDRIVRPAFDLKLDDTEFKLGIKGKRMQALTAQALLESLPDGVTGTIDFDPIPKSSPGNYVPIEWCGVLALNDEGTYAFGVHSMGGYFGWGNYLQVHRLGGPEVYEELARDASAAPSP